MMWKGWWDIMCDVDCGRAGGILCVMWKGWWDIMCDVEGLVGNKKIF